MLFARTGLRRWEARNGGKAAQWISSVCEKLYLADVDAIREAGVSKDGLLPVMEATHQILGTRDRVELRRIKGMSPKYDLTHQRTTWSGQP